MPIRLLVSRHWLQTTSYPSGNLKEGSKNIRDLVPSYFYALRDSIQFSANHLWTSVSPISLLSSGTATNLILATILCSSQVLTLSNTSNQKQLLQRTEGQLIYLLKNVVFLKI